MSTLEYAEWLDRRANCGCLGDCPDCEETPDGEE